MNRSTAFVRIAAAGVAAALSLPVEAGRCSDAPWDWPQPRVVSESGAAETTWFVARSVVVDPIRLDKGTIPRSRYGETIAIRLQFEVLASWRRPMPRRIDFHESPVGWSLSSCNPPYRHTEGWDPADFRAGETWLLAAIRDAGPAETGVFRLSGWYPRWRWSEALALRHALGAPDHAQAHVEIPKLDDLASALSHRSPVRRDDAIWFWLSTVCGRDYLRWRLADLTLPDDETVLLRRMIERFSTYPTVEAGDVPLPPARPDRRRPPRSCTHAEAQWVEDRIGEIEAMR